MSGDNKFIALGELGKCALPEEITRKYPHSAANPTLVFNPADSNIPEDYKIKSERTIDVGPQLYVTILFWGCSNYIENSKDKIGYQISVLKRNPLREYADQFAREGMVVTRNISDHRWEFVEVTDPVYLEKDDIDFAKKAMKETIDNLLLPQTEGIVMRQVREHYERAKKGMVAAPPWFLEKRKIMVGGGIRKGRAK